MEEEGLQNNEIAICWVYCHVCKTDFNLGFKLSSNDTCDMCDTLKMALQESKLKEKRTVIQEKIDTNMKDAETRYNNKMIWKILELRCWIYKNAYSYRIYLMLKVLLFKVNIT